jgi:hypothetical protein
MDTGVTIRPNANVATQGYATAVVASPDPATTTTDLPASKAVTASTATAKTRNDAPPTTHEVVIDPATREVIFRVVDVRSRQVVRQVPDEALLRTRAYAQAIANGDSPMQALNQADLDVEA